MNTCISIIHTHTRTHAHARALSLIPALTRTNTHAFVLIFMSACMNATMCMVRVCRYKRECEDFIYTHVFVCIYTDADTLTHTCTYALYMSVCYAL